MQALRAGSVETELLCSYVKFVAGLLQQSCAGNVLNVMQLCRIRRYLIAINLQIRLVFVSM